MLTTEFRIPISMGVALTDVLHGIFEIEGLLTCSGESLTLEYQTKELLGRGNRVRSVELPLDSLRDVSSKRKISGSTITLRPHRLSALEDLPLSADAQIVLKVKRAYRKDAEAMAEYLQRVLDYRRTDVPLGAIPFKGKDVGLREIKGHLYLEGDDFLVIDLQDALVGEFDIESQLIKVAPSALQDVRLEQRRIRDHLYIRPKGRDLLDAMPGSYTGEIELKIRRKHRDNVARLIYELTRLSDRSLPSEDVSL